MRPIKDFPPPLLMGSTTRYRAFPQAMSCRPLVAAAERTSESESGIPGFHQHTYFPPTHPLFPPTLPPTHFQDTLVLPGSNQNHLNAQKSHPHKRMGLQKTSWEVLDTERVGFEPTRVLPLHDFESCAINRTLPPLHTPLGANPL